MKSFTVTLLLGFAFLLGVMGNYLLAPSIDGEPVDVAPLLDTARIDLVLAPTTPSHGLAVGEEDQAAGQEVTLESDWLPASLPPTQPEQPTPARQDADSGMFASKVANETFPSDASESVLVPANSLVVSTDDVNSDTMNSDAVRPDTGRSDTGTEVKETAGESAADDTALVLAEDPGTGGDFVEEVAAEDVQPEPATNANVVLVDDKAVNDVAVDEPVETISEEGERADALVVTDDEGAASNDLVKQDVIEDVEQFTNDQAEMPNPAAVSADAPEASDELVVAADERPVVEESTGNTFAVDSPAPQEASDDIRAGRIAESRDGEPSAEAVVATEVFREHYPDGALKVEREVILDDSFNYVTHGYYRYWSEAGNLLAEGRMKFGRRTGLWKRAYARDQSEIFSYEPFKSFREPFVSTATFRAGRLHGKWTIRDSENRIVSEIEFVDGARHGSLLHYYPDGSKMREIDFRNGLVDGSLRDFGTAGELIREHKYLDGHYCSVKVESFVSTTKKSETHLLHPRMTIKSPDDWWQARLAEYGMEEGEPLRHGLQTVWYETGQVRFRGEFARGLAAGAFVWFQENGQMSRQGEYVAGKQHGLWSWWHANGNKSVLGNYDHGTPVGRWLFWKPGGQLDQLKELSTGDQAAPEGGAVREPSSPPSLPGETAANSA